MLSAQRVNILCFLGSGDVAAAAAEVNLSFWGHPPSLPYYPMPSLRAAGEKYVINSFSPYQDYIRVSEWDHQTREAEWVGGWVCESVNQPVSECVSVSRKIILSDYWSCNI